jgi:RNA polymerase sigma-70 factor (ECF subfamily)
MKSSLRTAFLGALAGELRARLAQDRGLERTLGRAVEAARRRWPFTVEDERFLRFLARSAPGDLGSAEELLRLRLDEIYLLCACDAGEARALEVLESKFMTRVEAALLRLGTPKDLSDDVRQNLWMRLFPKGGAPGAAFSGRGELVGWLCVSAVREAGRARRRARATPSLEEALSGAGAEVENPELAYFRARYRSEFLEALAEATRALAARDRNLLRYQVLERLSIDEIGAIYGVHRATAARWIDRARRLLNAETRRALKRRIGASGTELSSILRFVRKEVDLTVGQFLRE